jgi:hypothetical protein
LFRAFVLAASTSIVPPLIVSAVPAPPNALLLPSINVPLLSVVPPL